jgi:hypothetical protein
VTWLIVSIIYLGIGVGVMLWIQKDNEFREASGADMFAYGAIILWPVLGPLWYYLRPPEQIQDLAASKTYADFKNFMKARKHIDSDLLSKLDKQTSPDQPLALKQGEEWHDKHLEDLIESGNWNEAMRTANDMLRFSREQQEAERVEAYTRYIKLIMDRRREELD